MNSPQEWQNTALQLSPVTPPILFCLTSFLIATQCSASITEKSRTPLFYQPLASNPDINFFICALHQQSNIEIELRVLLIFRRRWTGRGTRRGGAKGKHGGGRLAVRKGGRTRRKLWSGCQWCWQRGSVTITVTGEAAIASVLAAPVPTCKDCCSN